MESIDLKSYKLPIRIEDNFGSALHALLGLLEFVGEHSNSIIELKYDDALFTHPFLTAGISGINEKFSSRLLISANNFNHHHIQSYMSLVNYPDGIQIPWPYPANIDNLMLAFRDRFFLPILNFPVDDSDEADKFRQVLMSSFESLLINQGDLKGETIVAIKYFINEMIDNMVNHSFVPTGKIFAQAFPNKRFMDICLLDSGRTLLDSYKKDERSRYPLIFSHLQAIEAAVNGKSTKDMEISRGYGISTSRRMLTEGLRGNFFMLSGSAWFYQDFKTEASGDFGSKVFWPGVYTAIRIPLLEISGFNHSSFLTN